jgi:hypothetical protein
VASTKWSGAVVNNFDNRDDNEDMTSLTQMYVTTDKANAWGKHVEVLFLRHFSNAFDGQGETRDNNWSRQGKETNE